MTGIVRAVRLFIELYGAYASRPPRRHVRHPLLKRTRWIRWSLWALVVVGLCALLTQPATAAPGFDVFDPLLRPFEGADGTSRTWFETIRRLVKPAFLILVAIEFCWAAAIWALEKDSLNSLTVEMIKKFMFIGFLLTLLQFAPEWIPKLVNSFEDLGKATGNIDTISTDAIVAKGLAKAGSFFVISLGFAGAMWAAPDMVMGSKLPLVGTLHYTAMLQMLVCVFVAIGVVISFVIVAAQYFTLKLESFILLAAGAVLLGLGSSSWTKDYVTKYLNYAIHVGMRLLVLILILSVTLNAIDKIHDVPALVATETLKLLAAAILQAILAIKAPEMASALLNGGGTGLSAGAAMTGGKGMMGAAMGPARFAAATAVSTGQGLANATKAVGAGRDIAQQNGKSGAAAALSGLNKAVQQFGNEAAKSAPGKLMDAVKGRNRQGAGFGGNPGGNSGGNPGGDSGANVGAGSLANPGTSYSANPGVFDRARQNLQARAASGAAAAATTSTPADAAAAPSTTPSAESAGPDTAGASAAGADTRSSESAAMAKAKSGRGAESMSRDGTQSSAASRRSPAETSAASSAGRDASGATSTSEAIHPATSTSAATATAPSNPSSTAAKKTSPPSGHAGVPRRSTRLRKAAAPSGKKS